MADHMTLYLFGDQTYDIEPHMRDLLRHRRNPLVEDFLVKAYNAIRSEIYGLPAEIRDGLPRFTCVDDLVFHKRGGRRCIPLDMATTCMFQLGSFISQANSRFSCANNTLVLGLCTGALAAAAISCSRDTLELIPMAINAVVVAFRTGSRVTEVARSLEPMETSDSSWSTIIAGSASSESVLSMCKEMMKPITTMPYVSAYTPSSITLSGPPRSLNEIKDSTKFKDLGLKVFHIDGINGPYHAPHLYSSDDVEDVVRGALDIHVSAHSKQVPVLSSAGPSLEGGNFESLLKDAVGQILLRPIRWSDILEELQLCLQECGSQTFSVVPIGTKADQVIHAALKQTSLRALLSAPGASNKPSISDDLSDSSPSKPKLAIIGMSGRFPGAKDNKAFWDLLYQGLDVHKPAPALHWDVKTHVDTKGTSKNTSATPYGCWLDDPGEFDARFFNISPREAPQIDPAQRLALMTAYEAIEQAGLVPDMTPSTRRDRVGVFYGVASSDWMETNSAQNIDTYFIPGGQRAFIPGRINYCFKFSGPSFAIDTACSSSLAGIHLACNSLWRGDVDTAIAGGTSMLTNPDLTAGLDRGHFLSRTGNCKTFDDDADGYCRGEAIGSVIIKRLDDAIADDDPILGVILGASTNHSSESESITRPHVGAQRAIFKKVLNQGAVDPYTVSYVEMHGTGTQAGDAGEISSTLETFAPPLNEVKKGRGSDEALYLGSAKANIGHGESASGVSSLIKVLLMMQKNFIVPHCGIKTKINHNFPLDLHDRNVNIALEPTPWKRSSNPSKPRRVFVNNFSAAGGNSALLLEDAPSRVESPNVAPDPRNHHVVAVSARTGVSLQGNLRSLLSFLRQNDDVTLGELSYTTTARRMHHQYRVLLACSSIPEVSRQIEAAIRDQTGLTRPKSTPEVLFTFTGQGAQYPGMGKQLLEHFSLFRKEMLRLDRIGQTLGFPSMLPVIESDEQDISIFQPIAVQLASVCMQLALSKLWASWKITPTAVVGHSLGEYAALNVAGVLSDSDTVYLVGTRAGLLQELCTRNTHEMLVVKAPVNDIAGALGSKKYEIACINSPVETVLAGPSEDVSLFKQLLTDAGLKTTLLKVPYAFHSSQIDPVLADFETLASAVTYHAPRIPLLCPLDGSVIRDVGNLGPVYLARHSREPVNMLQALLTARNEQVVTAQTTMLEIGPHPAISGMVKAVLGPQTTSLASLQRGRSTFQSLSAALKSLYEAGADISWSKYHQDFKASHKVLALPAYSWDLKEYWIQYVNDWSLRKGDAPVMMSKAAKLESTTIHRIVEESGDSQKAHIIVEANIARKDLSPLVQGHEVDGIPLCTPSIYADIALSLGTYLLERYHPEQQENLVDVANMIISKALILKTGATQQLLQARAEVDWSSKAATIIFMSFDNQQKLQEHSRCSVHFRTRSLLESLRNDAANVKQKIQCLREGIATGVTARFNRPMAYRALRPLARFHDDYRAIDEMVVNSETLEASSSLSFGTVKKGGSFHTHPAVIDALTQSSGFTMNCNDGNDLDVEVFMNHGWGSFQLFEPMDFDKTYTTYTRMVEGKDKLWHGDIVIFDGEKVVAFFGQFAMQGVPRRVLKVILSIESGSKTQQSFQRKQPGPTIPAPSESSAMTAAPTNGPSQDPKIATALSIIAEESGLALQDLSDATDFTEVGVDSLMGLTISARFKEELELDLDFNALFYDCPTVRDLKDFLGGSEADPTGSSSDSAHETESTGVTTPTSEGGSFALKANFQRALAIISEESGVAMEDLTDDTDFADSGIDSLLSLVIVSRLRDELQLDIQHETLFLDCPTVADLRLLLCGDTRSSHSSPSSAEIKHDAIAISAPGAGNMSVEEVTPVRSAEETAALEARKKAVDGYVSKHTVGFSAPMIPSSSTHQGDGAKVVLVTGATGGLGSNLVDAIARIPDVKTVVCLNRTHKTEPYVRQQKAMREKGIRTFDTIRSKLVVFQTDSSQSRLGLSSSEYEGLVSSVTHLIHQAWPMSTKRALAGFESQFQVMRNLVDFANDVASRRSEHFKFTFQMISSISVVGHYGVRKGSETTMVPEDRVGIDSLLPIGYADAKWGCERMLDETLHKHPHRFRATTVRLGQIAGSKTSGYWNPMEHFGFLIKSSQTLNALPDVGGKVYWTPVNDIAASLSDIILSNHALYPVYHIENPVGQSWREMNAILSDALKIPNLIPFDEWVDRVRKAPQKNNPAATLLDFLDSNYLRMSCGQLVLDTKKAVEHSKTLAAVGPVGEEVVRKYVRTWKEIGFIH